MNFEDAKTELRALIVDAAQIYSAHLAGKCYLYVYGDEHFEVVFRTGSFLHLTGVYSSLKAADFYHKAKNRTLAVEQFDFSHGHSIRNARKKLPCLLRLPEMTNSTVCVLKDVQTESVLLKIALSNLDFTLGLVKDEKMIPSHPVYVPQTMRVKDKSIERSGQAEFIDFVFMRQYGENLYTTRTFCDSSKTIPLSIESMINLSE